MMTRTDLTASTLSLPPMSRLVFAVAHKVMTWELRRQARRGIAKLDTHLLRDIGLDPMTAAQEAQKPFWRG
ncbi:DUF1127 domain-containing protein [Gemmobacter lutimaris]|uniref:DUF1127 domain-containing protein n=2 Tax=Gemmobacter lutimaris TaxID=2306023 RepID=A0A398BNN8_9RHOB|nr:DUF1127 domain-containing protein [Gemmobacter lutimaris]